MRPFCQITVTTYTTNHHNRFTALFPGPPGQPVPEENFWILWCKGRLTEADTPTVRLGATPSGLTSAHLHHPPMFFTGRMPFLPPNQQHQSTEGSVNQCSLTTNTSVLNAWWHQRPSAKAAAAIPQEFSGRLRKDEARGWIIMPGVSALGFLERSDIVGWASGRASGMQKPCANCVQIFCPRKGTGRQPIVRACACICISTMVYFAHIYLLNMHVK